jgi:hypothetical protein
VNTGPSSDSGVGDLARTRFRLQLAKLRASFAVERLDLDLAAGADPWCTSHHMLRAQRLGSFSHRRLVAAGVEDLVRVAEYRPGTLFTRLPIRGELIMRHRDELLALAARLRQLEPVQVDVVAQLGLLLRDGRSPIYVGGRPGTELSAILSHGISVLAGAR